VVVPVARKVLQQVEEGRAAAPTMTDIQNTHSSIASVSQQTLDDDVPGEYKDVAGMSNPGSLAKIMK
jgi:hypothetical protein